MIGSRAWWALMRRNALYFRRNWLSTMFELVLPIAFVGILVAIRNAVNRSGGVSADEIPALIPGPSNTFVPFTFEDYVTAMQAEKICLPSEPNSFYPGVDYSVSGIDTAGYNWQVPFVKCDARQCESSGQPAQEFCEYAMLALSPSSDTDLGGLERAKTFASWLYETYPVLKSDSLPFQFDFVQFFNTPEDMDSYVQSPDYGTSTSPKMAMGIVWEGNSTTQYSYSLRQNSTNFNNPQNARPAVTTTPNTKQLFSSYAKTDFDVCVPDDGVATQGPLQDSCTGQYLYNGILTMERLVGDFILKDTGAADAGYFVAQSAVQFVQFPQYPYVEGGFFADIGEFAPLLLILGFLYPVASMIGYVAKEKELRQKELMKMMSVTESDIGWSWFLSFFLLHLFVATITAGVSTQLYVNSEFAYLWLFWFFTSVSFVVFSMLMASLTAKAVRAVMIGLLIFFAGVFFPLAVSYETGDSGVLRLVSLLPVAAFSFGIEIIGGLEDTGYGLNKNTAGSTDNPSEYTFNNALSSLIFDCVLWGVVTWYLNRVIAPDYGQALPWNFLVRRSYWFPGSIRPDLTAADADYENDEAIPIEPVSEQLKGQRRLGTNIEIHKLRKVFGEKVAVENVSLSMYSGQITALLGHNGAGKTTTIGMLTGALSPSDGYATVLGKDIRHELPTIRQDLGICLQHDCLFPQLTVREHIQFFSRLKGLYTGMSKDEAEQHIDQVIQDLALSEKRNTRSDNLSGGMKRKLSVAIAFCGGSKVVMLDEPTSGMDPFSRRFTWNVIRQYRQDRVIILTTHFMDEADILGDRIAIMSEGFLKCVGSSLFLKKHYGVGYQLTIEKRNQRVGPGSKNQPSDHGSSHAEPRHDDDAHLNAIVTGAVSEAALLNNVGTEMSYQLPIGAASKFLTMFDHLDVEVDDGRIVSYGVSITTLDEVFLMVARGQESPNDKKAFASSKLLLDENASLATDADKSARSRMDLENEGLFLRHVGALFKKRAAFFKRDKKAWCCTTFVPSFFVLIGFAIVSFASPQRNLDPLILDFNSYNPSVTTTPRNPVAFNNPGSSYSCQPGKCAYQTPVVQLSETNELYYYCGYQARLSNDPQCSVDDSSEIVGRLNAAGSSPEPASVQTITESSQSLFDTSSSYVATQYGAIWFTHELASTLNNGSSYNNTVVQQCLSSGGNYTNPANCTSFGGYGYTISYNFTALHVSPLFQALADEALVRQSRNSDDFNIQVTIAPLPITGSDQKFGAADDATSAWFLVVLSFPFITGAFGAFIVTERESKAKHLQTVAGVQPTAYWFSSFLWDSMNYQIPLWITVILMFAFSVDVLTTRESNVVGGVITLLVLFGPASASFAYCFSFMFSSAILCNVVIIVFSFLIGLGGPLTCFILILIGEDPANPKPNLIDIANILSWFLRFIPSFCLGNGLLNAINVETIDYFYPGSTAWSKHVLLYEVIYLGCESIAYLLLAVQLDKWSSNPRALALWQKFLRVVSCKWLCASGKKVIEADETTVSLPEDDDVSAEQNRVLQGEANNDLIVMTQLRKIYGNGKVAVRGLSLGIPSGECFGLLGINGAGKTTTMQMLTAEFPPTSGDATLAGFSVTHEPEKTRRRIGYCPQFDAHFANLTGREHVELYASIKGIPKQFVKEAAASKLKEVGLSEFDSDRLSAGYSGGMKRRLSLACAMIGQPQIVFLDECSTGVDPVARREIWQLVSDMVTQPNGPDGQKTSVILTTHSMEECEALCPRIGIMANGSLRCLGSAQHLKNKFGQGYQVELKVKLVEESDDDYKKYLNEVREQHVARPNSAVAMSSRRRTSSAPFSDTSLGELPQGPGQEFLTLNATKEIVQVISGDTYLSDMISPDNPIGYNIFKSASSIVGLPIDELAAFVTSELRMRELDLFVRDTYQDAILRERQDTKVRYEVGSAGLKISSIFGLIEASKGRLLLSDYGVSQTSLEQVFNIHAAEAEKMKEGGDDH